MSNSNQPGYWKEKFRELTKTILNPNKGPYAGRTTIFMGAVIAFFCGVNILVGWKKGTEISPLNYVFVIVGLVDVVLGIRELKVQKVYEKEQEALELKKEQEEHKEES